MSRLYYSKDKSDYSFDYENQVWIKGGRYQDCGHPKHMNCECFGRKHKGEKAIITDYLEELAEVIKELVETTKAKKQL